MGAPDEQSVQEVPTASGGLARMVCARLRAAGLDLQPFLDRAGLESVQIDDPARRIGVTAQAKLLRMAAEALGDELLGFHLSQDLELREAGLIYYVLSSAESFAAAMRNAERYTRLVNEGLAIKFDAERMAISLDCATDEARSDVQNAEFWLFSLLRLCRDLTSTRIAPERVTFRHHRPSLPVEVRKFLGCDVTFDANADELVLPRYVEALPVTRSDQFLHRLLVRYAEEALVERTMDPTSLRFRVERAIEGILPHGPAKAAAVARELGMTSPNLARALAAEGATFSEILDRHRADLAVCCLKNVDLSVPQIAWLLGYDQVGTFERSFKRWFGKPPADLRRGSSNPDATKQR